MKEIKHTRHIAKAITWRIVGTLDTMALGWLVTGNIFVGLKIGLFELLTKTILYYFHERIWYRLIRIESAKSNLRHVLKAITWRFIGTIDTMIIGWITTGNLKIGFTIGGFELLTKTILYYIHERLWHRSNFGIVTSTIESSK
jgi:uncharacterized membrane protein